MKVRLFVEIEIDNAKLTEAFGPKLAEITASGAIEVSLAKAVGVGLGVVPNLKDVQINVIPIALHSDRLA